MSRLSNKVAIVTGASKGIGGGIATALGAAGARVAVNYSSASIAEMMSVVSRNACARSSNCAALLPLM